MENIDKSFLFLLILIIFLSLIVFLIGNNQLFLFINQKIANSILDFIVLYIFTPLFLLLGAVPFFMLFFKQYRALGAFSLVSGFLCYVSGSLLKLLFNMPRPFHVLPARVIGPWHMSYFSFPSSTTMLAFGLALPFLVEKPKYGLIFLTLAFLVGFSVIYTGFHFPQDVIAGIFLSLLIVFLLVKKLKSLL
ncbi:MAG: phosphatase PAP2 family protein [Candidatus Paceibacterales bacterium]